MRRYTALVVAALVAVGGCGSDTEGSGDANGAIAVEVPAHTGHTDTAEPLVVDVPAELPAAVVFDVGVTDPSAPRAVGDRIVYMESDRRLVTVEPQTLDLTTREFAATPTSIAGVLGDGVVVRSGDTITVLDGATLAERYTIPTPDGATGLRVVSVDPEGRHLVAGYEDAYASFSAIDGSLVAAAAIPPAQRIVVRSDTAAVQVDRDGDDTVVVTFDPSTGTPTGEVELGARRDHDLAGVIGTNRVLIIERGNFRDDPPGGWLYSLDTVAGSEVWRVESDKWFDEPLVADDLIAAPNQDGTVRRVDVVAGEIGSASTLNRVRYAPVGDAGRLVMVNVDAELLVIDAASGELLAEPLVLPDADEVHGWALVGDVLYVTVTQRVLNADDEPSRLFGVDLTLLVG